MILPQFQIQNHVNSIVLLPLWGFDCLDVQHNFMNSRLDREIHESVKNTDFQAIKDLFIPILTRLIELFNVQEYCKSDMLAFISAIVQ